MVALLMSLCPISYANPIKLGAVSSRTGHLAGSGEPVYRGIEIAVDKVNAKGGIHGKNITLISRDSGSTPEGASAAARELITKEGVIGLVGEYVDTQVAPVSDVAEDNKVPYIAACTLQRKLVERGYKYFFAMSNIAGMNHYLLPLVTDEFDAKKTAIIYFASAGSVDMAEYQRAELEKNGVDVVVYEKVPPTIEDFTPVLTKIKDEGAEVIIADVILPLHIKLVKQLRRSDVYVKAYIATYGADEPHFIDVTGNASENIFLTSAWMADVLTYPGTAEEAKAFTDEYEHRYGEEPASAAAHGYCAAKTMMKAMDMVLDEGKDLTSEDITKELRKIDYDTVMERVNFTNGEPNYYYRPILQIQNGTYKIVYPPELATAEMVYPEPKAPTPGFEAVIAIAAILLAIVIRNVKKR